MNIAFYNMPPMHAACKMVARKFGFTLVELPEPNKESAMKGVAVSPEFSCFPFKVILGAFRQALELGAEVLVIPGGESILACHLSDYPAAHQRILERLGYEFEIVVFKSFTPRGIQAAFSKYNPDLSLALVTEVMILFAQKLKNLEALDDLSRRIHLSAGKGEARRFKRKWEARMDKADSIPELYLRGLAMQRDSQKFPLSDVSKWPRIAVVGDIFSINVPYINNNLLERLCDIGLYPHNTIPTSWMLTTGKNPNRREARARAKSKKYLKHDVGGATRHTLASAIQAAEEGYSGIIHIYSFNCMPEVVARSILPKIAQDYGIPLLCLCMDEQTGDAGFATRVEAFADLVDMRESRRASKE